MIRFHSTPTLLVAVLVVLGPESSARSQPASSGADAPPILAELSGRYRYVGNAEKDRAKIQRSIDAAVTSLGWLGRKIAANRLANHKEIPQRIEIGQQGRDVAVKMGDYDAEAPIDGKKKELIAPNGRDATLSYAFTKSELLQLFVFERAKRKSTYRLNEAGQLVMSVYMTSEKLASPIRYDLLYDRESR